MTIAGIGILSAGCFSLQPAAGVAPGYGTDVAFDVNDVGRVALGGSMGPEISQISGRLMSKDGEDFVLAVSGVKLLNGGNQAWRGEVVRINTSYVSTVYNRRFSTGRTVAFTAAAIGAVAIFAGKTLGGSHVDPPIGPPDSMSTKRGRRPIGPLHTPLLRRLNPPRSY